MTVVAPSTRGAVLVFPLRWILAAKVQSPAGPDLPPKSIR